MIKESWQIRTTRPIIHSKSWNFELKVSPFAGKSDLFRSLDLVATITDSRKSAWLSQVTWLRLKQIARLNDLTLMIRPRFGPKGFKSPSNNW